MLQFSVLKHHKRPVSVVFFNITIYLSKYICDGALGEGHAYICMVTPA